MISLSRSKSFSLPLAKIFICLTLILTIAFLGGKKMCSAENWHDEKYIQSLPDESFAVVDTTPEGIMIRLLPHHDIHGNVVIPKLMECINQVFTLPHSYREIAREHLLQDYYEFVFPKLMGQDNPNP